jgi:putative hydrolase of HD superfamily
MSDIKNSFKDFLKFVEFTTKAHKVERVAQTPGMKRYSNLVEHSYQLTILAWYIAEKEKLTLDKDLIIKYAIVHDLPETYAGDTYIFDTEKLSNKKEREEKALKKIASNFPDFKELALFIKKYERKEDKESRFVYALDKLIDPVNIFLDNGKLWKKKNITFEMLKEYKTEKIKIDETVTKYYEELLKILEQEKEKMFPS